MLNIIGITLIKVLVLLLNLESITIFLQENDNVKSVMYSNMICLLIAAIKEQQKQIDELKENKCQLIFHQIP
jgi:hypothetical protein